jgi:hypothetical protein
MTQVTNNTKPIDISRLFKLHGTGKSCLGLNYALEQIKFLEEHNISYYNIYVDSESTSKNDIKVLIK